MNKSCYFLTLAFATVAPLHAEFLYESFLTPSFIRQANTESSNWDVFYAPNLKANYPDLAAPNGTRTTRSEAGFPADSSYSPGNPFAFWNTANPTITQTNAGTAFIIGPGAANGGNIYSFSGVTRFELTDTTPYVASTVVFQFQTEGTLADFSGIRLVFNDGTSNISLAANDYIREYSSSDSSFGGYGNRSALQWDLAGRNISSYKIVLQSAGPSMSFQRTLLDTAEASATVVPQSRTWNAAGTGTWSDGSKWLEGATSIANGNVKFANNAAAAITLDSDRTIGEFIFNKPSNVTIDSAGAAAFTANTGITSAAAANGAYTINSDWRMGAFNVFDLAAGTTNLNGVISGEYGFLKTGNGTLVLSGDNTFTGGVGVEKGTLRMEGVNSYAGSTTVFAGSLIVAGDALVGPPVAGSTEPTSLPGTLGNSTSAVTVGASDASFSDPGIPAELLIDGDYTIGRDVFFNSGPFEKRIGAFGTNAGANFSGSIDFGAAAAAASNVHLTARNASDTVTFKGAMINGATTATVIKDGAGRVIFASAGKTYSNSTSVSEGTLQIARGISFTGAGDMSVSSGARLIVDGTLSGDGALALNGGIIGGSGVIGRTFTVDAGDKLAPGNSVGILNTGSETWGGGGTYSWEISDATGAPGTGWDLLNITGSLNLTATPSSNFTIGLITLTAANMAGMAENFDANSSYTWRIASASDGIIGFDQNALALDLSGFQNARNGAFTLSQTGNDLFVVYTAVPEPSTNALIFGGLSWLAVHCRQFRKRRFT